MRSCSRCGETIHLVRECRYCGNPHCSDHLLPESHNCHGLQNVSRDSRHFESAFDDSVGTDSDDEESASSYRTVEPETVGTRPEKRELYTDSGPDIAPDGSIVYPDERERPDESNDRPWLSRILDFLFARR